MERRAASLDASAGSHEGGSRRGPWGLVALMVLSVLAIAAVAFWDAEREATAAFDDFASEQALLAKSVGAELEGRLSAARRDALLIAESLDEGRRLPSALLQGYSSYALRAAAEPPAAPGSGVSLAVPVSGGRTVDLVMPPASLFTAATRLERPGLVRVFLRAPGDAGLRASDGHALRSRPLEEALDAGLTSAWLARPLAVEMGFRPRRAAAGLARLDAGPLGSWGVAVVASAERERERELRAKWRLVLGVALAAGLVFLFGTVAIQRQRRGLLLERELSLTALARQRDERLAQASKTATLGTLAMGIAHEVSTPLGVIAGRAEQLTGRLAGDDRSARALSAILEQTERIRRVVKGFLDLARGSDPALAEVAPKLLLAEAAALVEHRFASAGVSLVTHAPEGLPPLRCDVSMLEQAIVNLLLNAGDACARGGRVEASVALEAERMVFTVADDGAGITPEDALRATEPFFTTKGARGNGLGLAIATEIVKLHRGSLSLAPGPDKGTRAVISVPVRKADIHAAA